MSREEFGQGTDLGGCDYFSQRIFLSSGLNPGSPAATLAGVSPLD
jgi:hypothetical protein